jgi:sulfate adenylyltransferase subunit 1
MDGNPLLLRPVNVFGGRQIRFMTAGSVDDGKSTLIGRLLLDAGALMRDQAEGLDGDDLASLTDGLEAERAQGITIDVAYRYFAIPGASFIIADAPGHEQYTRNMVTAASVSDVAVIVIDASGATAGQLKPQTRRHAAIAALMGLDVIVAVNKMDAVGWSRERFEVFQTAFAEVANSLGVTSVDYVPISAKSGANVVRRGGATWWSGATLLDLVRQSRSSAALTMLPLRLPVQTTLRDGARRYYAGRIAAGTLRPGDMVAVGAQALAATVATVRIGGRAVSSAGAGESVAVELVEDRDVSRGDVIAAPGVRYVRRVVADLCWLGEEPWRKEQRYTLRQGTLETSAMIDAVNYLRAVEDFAQRDADSLALNDIANVRVSSRDPVLPDRYEDSPGVGAFVLFDPRTNQTCAAGMIREALE